MLACLAPCSESALLRICRTPTSSRSRHRGRPEREARVDVEEIARRDQRRLVEIRELGEQRIERAERAVRRIAVAARDVGLECEARRPGQAREREAGLARDGPRADLALRE